MKLQCTYGFSMLEVLVAILVVSLGMLGMAALHAAALRNTNSSYYRSIAVSLAQDMSNRLRANQLAQPLSTSISPYASFTDNTSTPPTSTATVTSGVVCLESTAICSPTVIANYDYYHFWTDVHNLLPSGIGVVCSTTVPNEATPNPTTDVQCDTPNPDNHVLAIKIYWKDSRYTNAWLLYSLVVRV